MTFLYLSRDDLLLSFSFILALSAFDTSRKWHSRQLWFECGGGGALHKTAVLYGEKKAAKATTVPKKQGQFYIR
ncbi:hypothetical protein CEXT_369581 [Caerostris extrusa]|uniref:Secreted protein n=1 Tax=Caerostris extrusa TaxID=172846 RepID=A0AAV4SXA9_CAEEX|nr:hypothetical protein CEXT_369581 [Caerostris extrusa]